MDFDWQGLDVLVPENEFIQVIYDKENPRAKQSSDQAFLASVLSP